MNKAESLQAFYGDNIDAIKKEAEEIGYVTTTDESTEYDFADGSVLIAFDDFVAAYGSR